MAKLHYTNKLAELLRNITIKLVGLWQNQRPTRCIICWALVLPEPNKLANKSAQWNLSANKLYKK
jgi:hypothetical protein